MGAPRGNQFWKLRSKHGRDLLFDSPKKLWEAACEYFQWVDTHPEYEVDFVGKDATRVKKPRKQPYTLHGLCLYLDCGTNYFVQFKQALEAKTDDKSKDFSVVVTRIEEIIYNQKFSGAVSGFFKENIISRELGLADKINQDHSGKIKHNIKIKADLSKLTSEELKALRDLKNKLSGQ